MTNQEYVLAASSIVNRAKERRNPEISPEEQEISKLFYWILGIIQERVEICCYVKKQYNFTIKEILYGDDNVMLRYGAIKEYRTVMLPEAFHRVIQKVVDIFDAVPNYQAKALIPENEEEEAEIYIYLNV